GEPVHLHRNRGGSRARGRVRRWSHGVQAESLRRRPGEGGPHPEGLRLRPVILRTTLALLLLAVSAASGASPPRFVDYLYIEANEGGSSGGPAAIRFGDETYHFQHERPGIIRIRRDGFEQFRYAYGVLENRTMHVSRIAVSDQTYAELRRRFGERLLIERKLFAERDALRDDR